MYRAFRERLRTNDPPRICQRCNLVEGISKGNSEFFDAYRRLGFLQRMRFNTKRVLRGEI